LISEKWGLFIHFMHHRIASTGMTLITVSIDGVSTVSTVEESAMTVNQPNEI
jgi:hypothetical protein